jgi:tRNA(adenine34) deaminase
MSEALKEAKKALKYGDVPVGSLLVMDGKIISRAYNQVERLRDSTAHAELICIRKGIKEYGYKHLLECTLYTTLEPCPMCAGAIVLARISQLVYGATDKKSGASESLYKITSDKRLNHRCKIISGIKADESVNLLKNFFNELRKNTLKL